MEKCPAIPPNFVTLRDLKERREREQKLKLQQSIQVEKEEESEVTRPLISPVHIKGEEKEEGSFNNFPPKPPKCTTNENSGRGRGHREQSAIIGAQAAGNGSDSLKHTTNRNRRRGSGPSKQSTIIGAQASANGSTSNAEKKESAAEVDGVITELSLTDLSCASDVAMGEMRTEATAALVDGGKTGGRVGLDIERRISGLHINGRNSNSKSGGEGIGGGRGYPNNWQKSSSSTGKEWVVKKSRNEKVAASVDTDEHRSRDRGHRKQSTIIGAQAAVNGSTSLKHTTNQNRRRGWCLPKQSTIIGAQAMTNGSTSNAEKKKESAAEVESVTTKSSLTGLSCASEVAMGEKRTIATPALVDGGKTGGRVAPVIERRISGLHITGRYPNSKRGGKGIGGGRGYANNYQKSSSSTGTVWAVKQSLYQKDKYLFSSSYLQLSWPHDQPQCSLKTMHECI